MNYFFGSGLMRIRVVLYGLFPTLFNVCVASNDLSRGLCNPRSLREQLSEYPQNMVNNQDFMVELVAELYRFGNLVRLEIVNADSARGLWYAIRYRLGKGPAVIVNNKVFRGADASPIKIREYIESILDTY